ncbi:hypothetical protein B2J93_9427 [Marssonina coronariae]|uniref:Uncharacterized protein n=1 Tax=Diplocarpon coronariae TaxID=2795749 RepID=A0A218YS90_9HELO|nr:hypothetical protein B2J93_9427 [Marssonina coronariae]
MPGVGGAAVASSSAATASLEPSLRLRCCQSSAWPAKPLRFVSPVPRFGRGVVRDPPGRQNRFARAGQDGGRVDLCHIGSHGIRHSFPAAPRPVDGPRAPRAQQRHGGPRRRHHHHHKRGRLRGLVRLGQRQLPAIYDDQTAFGVRLVRLDVYLGPDYGASRCWRAAVPRRSLVSWDTGVATTIEGQGCCASGVEQLVRFTDTSAFPTANLQT